MKKKKKMKIMLNRKTNFFFLIFFLCFSFPVISFADVTASSNDSGNSQNSASASVAQNQDTLGCRYCDEDGLQGEIVFPNIDDYDPDDPDTQGEIGKMVGGAIGAAFGILGFNEGIFRVGQGVEESKKKTSATVNKSFDTQNEVLRDIITGFETGKQKVENQRTFGKKSIAYNSEKGDLGKKGYVGEKAVGKFSNKVRDSIRKHLRSRNLPKEGREYYSKLDTNNTSLLMSKSRLAPEEIKKMQDVISVNVSAHPPLNMPFKEGEVPEKRENITADYEAVRKAQESRQMIPIAVLSDYLSNKAPVFDLGEWASSMNYGEYPDKLSKNQFLKAYTDIRFANDEWLSGSKGIHGKTKSGLLRELVRLEVNRLKMAYEKMLMLNQLTLLAAQKQLDLNEKVFDDVLRVHYEK